MRPVARSRLRLAAGVCYYRLKRYGEWLLGGKRFSREKQSVPLPHLHVRHQTPLLRRLKDVDMWMQHNKIINLRLAVERLDGVVVRPSETFSYWRLIGKPTRRKGYVEGMLLSHGRLSRPSGAATSEPMSCAAGCTRWTGNGWMTNSSRKIAQ